MQAVQEDTVVNALQLVAEDYVRVGNIDLSEEEAQNVGLGLLQLDQAPVPFLRQLLKTKWKSLTMRSDGRESPAWHLLCWCGVAEENFVVDSCTDGKDLLLVLLGIESCPKSDAHQSQGRSIQIIGVADRRDHVRVLCENLKFAVGSILDGTEVGVLDLEPAGAHDILPENKLFEEGCVGTKYVREGLARQI